ncbi:MAG: DUF1799 domain-containing protein [Alphaproteobacteria bacterium]
MAKWQIDEANTAMVVPEDNWPVVNLFVALQTQWRLVPLTTLSGADLLHQGIDYSVIPVVAAAMNIKCEEHVLRGLRIMEAEAVQGLAAERIARSKARAAKSATGRRG